MHRPAPSSTYQKPSHCCSLFSPAKKFFSPFPLLLLVGNLIKAGRFFFFFLFLVETARHTHAFIPSPQTASDQTAHSQAASSISCRAHAIGAQASTTADELSSRHKRATLMPRHSGTATVCEPLGSSYISLAGMIHCEQEATGRSCVVLPLAEKRSL